MLAPASTARTSAVAWTARRFRGGEAELEVVKAYTSGDLAVLVAVERQVATVGGLPSRTGRYASPWYSAARDRTGASYTGMPTRSSPGES